jgi:hypothetical protein
MRCARRSVVWGNSGATLFDIGDGVLNLEFHTKMNTIGSEILQGLNKAIDIAERRPEMERPGAGERRGELQRWAPTSV